MDETSARFLIRPVGPMAEVVYLGAIAGRHLASMRDAVLDGTRGTVGLLIRLDTSLLLYDELPTPNPNAYRENSAPAAVIVGAHAYAMHVEYSRKMAQLGVLRAVFLSSQIEQARNWSEWAQRVRSGQ